MTKRYFLELAYRGTTYHGWQVQPNNITVQSVVTEALSTIFNEPIRTLGCGRTDSGVHASQFFLHFDGPTVLPEKLLFRLNKFLPRDIAIHRILTDVPQEAHARFDATYRAYTYHVHFDKSPFLYDESFFFPWLPLDWELMQQAVDLLPTYTNFPMFCKSGGSHKTTLCTIFKAELNRNEETGKMTFHIAANRFLRGMVRRIMGCILMMGKGKISLAEFVDVMENSKNKFEKVNISVPPQGLFLVEVRYPYV